MISPFRNDLLKDHKILITGGGSGLGKSLALGFATLGASVAICGRRRDVLEETAAELNKIGGTHFFDTCDVRKPDEVARVVDGAFSSLGQLTGLINNAAGNFVCPTEALSANAFNAVVGIVLNGTFHCTQAVAKHWIEKKQAGSVINICTTYAWTGSALVVPSVCAKAGVLAMTRSLAVEWGRHNIRLNAIAPGPFKTEGAWKNLMPAGFEKFLVDKNPMKRLGTHEELVTLAALLLSGSVNYINGDCITIDGGEWLQGAGQFNGLLTVPPEQLEQLKR
ncbi:MAG: hypothetical protein COV45_00240 [Deltaproteobacteria bacterium CG11_big_fil_rev_8_21_14_0_20_47_16]|nr:MAG: hypothetical protein COV45_00240 [Deltaproteobacteria bacterium CG11_big_fil_rev_8_21_14_0_20_47_16]